MIATKAGKWESVLLHLCFFALLMPSAFQAITSGLIGLTFLFRRGWRSPVWQLPLPRLFKSFVIGLAITWVVLLLNWLSHGILDGSWRSDQTFRLIGKQGLWGSFMGAGLLMFMAGQRRFPLRFSFALGFVLLNLVYCLLQRNYGFNWVHGWSARLSDNRLAYDVYRVSGWMDHPLSFGFNLTVATLLCFGLSLRSYQEKLTTEARQWLALSLALLVMLMTTGSRFPQLLTLGLLFAACFWQTPRLRRLLAIGLVAGVSLLTLAILFLPAQSFGRFSELWDGSVPLVQRFDRLIFWDVHLRLFLEEPWIGSGLNAYKDRILDTYQLAGYTELERKYNAHNIFLQTLADLGLLGLSGLLVLFGALGRLAWKSRRSLAGLSLILIALATVGSGLVQNNLRDSEYLYALWAAIGLSLAYGTVQGTGDDRGQQPEN